MEKFVKSHHVNFSFGGFGPFGTTVYCHHEFEAKSILYLLYFKSTLLGTHYFKAWPYIDDEFWRPRLRLFIRQGNALLTFSKSWGNKLYLPKVCQKGLIRLLAQTTFWYFWMMDAWSLTPNLRLTVLLLPCNWSLFHIRSLLFNTTK